MPAEEVVQAYTGHHWHVDLAALTEAAHYALYAEAAYGVEATRPSRLSRWKNEVQIAWKRKRRKGRAGAVNTYVHYILLGLRTPDFSCIYYGVY